MEDTVRIHKKLDKLNEDIDWISRSYDRLSDILKYLILNKMVSPEGVTYIEKEMKKDLK